MRHAKLNKGEIRQNRGGGTFEAITDTREDKTKMRNTKSGWTFIANTVTEYDDGTIEWDYSTGGHFE